MTNALELINVTKKYPGFLLDKVSFTLPSGCIMGFIGENGAGKSTTIKLILDLIRKDAGEIRIFGMNDYMQVKTHKEHIGVVLDESSFPESLNLNNVNTIMKRIYKTWDEDRFLTLAKRFKLSPNKKILEYSRGMKMKLAIAVALSHDTKLLILDEATSGLDPIVRDEILDVFLDFIQEEDHSIFISSHILSDLEKICDYITFIHKGNIVFSEAKDDLLESYGVLKCTKEQFQTVDPTIIKGYRENRFGIEALVLKHHLPQPYVVDPATIEDIMLFQVKGE